MGVTIQVTRIKEQSPRAGTLLVRRFGAPTAPAQPHVAARPYFELVVRRVTARLLAWDDREVEWLLGAPEREPDAETDAAVRAAADTLTDDQVAALVRDAERGVDPWGPLYQDLVPTAARHDLGEHYTPRWLAEHLLDRLAYDGDPDRRILDPACGSGTFLLCILGRVRRWWADHRARSDLGEAELTRKILHNVVGLDVSPIAALTARANYLLGLGALRGFATGRALPVLERDTLAAPPLPEHENGFDLVAGNPPWVTWIHLPERVRRETRPLWTERYELMAEGGSRMANLGQVCKDLSTLFTLVCLDRYLRPTGRLGFVITQTVFQSPAAREFRRFRIPGRGPYRIEQVDDLVALRPFTDASTRTACFTASLGVETTYPVGYTVWTPRDGPPAPTDDLARVLARCERTPRYAFPATTDPESVWTICREPTYRARPNRRHETAERYRARKSLQTGLVAVFRVILTPADDPGLVVARNVRKGAKRKVPQRTHTLEKAVVFPYVRGGDCRRYAARCSGHLLLPHTPETGMQPVDEARFRRRHPQAYAYLEGFRAALETRAVHRRWGASNPFYACYNVGPYTFAPHKVIWPRVADRFEAAVVSTWDDPLLGRKLLVPTETVLAVAFDSAEEAHYFCAYVNAPQNRALVERSITIHPDSQILEILQVPRFDPEDPRHRELAAVSERAHARLASLDGSRAQRSEARLALERADRRADVLVDALLGVG